MGDAMPIRITRKTGKIEELLKSTPKSSVITVGINQKEGATRPNKGGATLAEIGSFQEYGWVQKTTPKQSAWLKYNSGLGITPNSTLVLPPRPFIRATANDNAKRWAGIIKATYENTHSVEQALNTVGTEAVADIRETIRNGGTASVTFTERSPLTRAILDMKKSNHATDGTGNIDRPQALMLDGTLEKSITWNWKTTK